MDFYQLVVLLTLALAALVILGSGQRSLQVGLIVTLLALGLGYRTISVTHHLRLHPAELLLWGTFLLMLLQRSTAHETRFWLPRWVSLFIPFWCFAWVPGALAGRPWDQMLAEFKNFLVLVPLFAVAEITLAERVRWRPIALVFYLVGSYIGGMGLLQYLFPTVVGAIPGFAAVGAYYGGPDVLGFRRATFSFFGSAVATFVLVLTIPFAHVLWRWYPRRRPLILLALLAQVGGMYIGGYRSMWLSMLAQITVWIFLSYGPILGGFATMLLSLAGVWLLPQVAQDHLYSLALALEGQAADSSAINRITFISDAWAATLRRPWGSGWAGSGWVHSDFVQVFANLGLLAGLLFLGAWMVTVLRLLTKVLTLRKTANRSLGVSLLVSMGGAGGILWSQGVQVLLQLILPVWFVWVLAEIWLRQGAGEPPLDVEGVEGIENEQLWT